MTAPEAYIVDRGLERCEVDGKCSGCDSPGGGSWAAEREDSGLQCFVCGDCLGKLAAGAGSFH